MKELPKRVLRCRCEAVELEVSGTPIQASICHCDDCQRDSAKLEALPGAAAILDAYGGTAYVLYRKDRVRITRGSEVIAEHRIEGEKNTRRLVASCCNTPLFLDFEPGHWFSLYQQLFGSPVPASTMRIQCRFMQTRSLPSDGLPRYKGFAASMMARLLIARIAMGRKRD